MYYFKCSNCGYLNHLNSEYLIFCAKCGKKLQITYRDWHFKNPDKNLNDFHELFCIHENEIKKTTEKVRKINARELLKFISILILSFLILTLESLKMPSFLINNIELKEIKNQKWSLKYFGDISVETPFTLIDAGVNIHNEAVENFKSYGYTSDNGFEMLLTKIKYTENIAEKNIISIASDPLNQMQTDNTIIDFKFNKTYTLKNKINGILSQGSFLRKDEKYEFIEATYADKSFIWQVILVFKPAYNWDKYKAFRILNSLNMSE